MKRKKPKAVLVYGNLQPLKIQTDIPVVDVTEPDWEDLLEKETQIEEKDHLLCLGQAHIIAKRSYPSAVLKKVADVDKACLLLESYKEIQPAAVKTGDIIVSRQYNPAVDNSKAWLSTYHLDLVKSLVGKGFIVEILDENGEPITKIEDKG